MTGKDKDQIDDGFELFLQRQDELSRQLQSLPQPAPSAELDAAILAKVEAELTRTAATDAAANDPALPGAAASPLPGFLSRWRTPLSMAASVMLVTLVLLRWQTQADKPVPLVVAQAPEQTQEQSSEQILPQANTAAAAPPAQPRAGREKIDGKMLAARPQAADAARTEVTTSNTQIAQAPDTGREAEAALQIAQADTQDAARKTYAPAPAPAPVPSAIARAEVPVAAAPAPAAIRPPGTDSAPSNNPEKARAWLALIDELLKADLRQDALAEWEKFRKAYPQYPVPEKFEARIKALKK